MLLIVILCYAGTLAAGTLLAGAAHAPTVLTGRAWSRLNFGFAVAAGLTAFGSGPERAVVSLLVAGALLVPVPALRPRWFIFMATQPEVEAAVESSLSRVRVGSERVNRSWRLQILGEELEIQARTLVRGIRVLTFVGDWRPSKARLTMRTMRKSFESIVPAIRLHL